MRLVISMLTINPLSNNDIIRIKKIFSNNLAEHKKIQEYIFDDREYYEVDIDVFDIVFTKEEIYSSIDKLILICEKILLDVNDQIDFIIGNDDTEHAIVKYENDKNDINNVGLFVTKREIPNIKPYYTSKICNAYVNLTHVSFGVY